MVELETLVVLGAPVGPEAEKLHDLLAGLYAREAVLDSRGIQPQRVYHLARLVSDVARRTAILAAPEGLDAAARAALAVGSELVLVVDEAVSREALTKLQAAYEQGVESISVYVECTPPTCHRVSRSVSQLLAETGLPAHLRIGPPLFKPVDTRAFERIASQLGRPGLPYGLLYGYLARRIRLETGVLATLLEPPCPRDCRRIAFDAEGAYKCPLSPAKPRPYHSLTLDAIEAIASSSCGRGAAATEADIRVKLSILYNGVEVPEDVLKVLLAVKMTKSFRAACTMLGYNPSHMIVKIRRLETRMGVRLLEGHRGGRGGGYTELTRVGDQIVKKYIEARSLLGDLE